MIFVDINTLCSSDIGTVFKLIILKSLILNHFNARSITFNILLWGFQHFSLLEMNFFSIKTRRKTYTFCPLNRKFLVKKLSLWSILSLEVTYFRRLGCQQINHQIYLQNLAFNFIIFQYHYTELFL